MALPARPESVPSELRRHFEEKGFLGPLPIFDGEESRRIQRLLENAPPPLDWLKGHAASSQAYYAIGSHPAIVDRVAELIGEDVMLWGASLVRRKRGQVHPWHTDIETSANVPGSVTVWIGLENTSRQSSLQLIPYSHRFGMTIQERAQKAGKARAEVAIADVLRWARERDHRCEPVQLDTSDGDAILLDGRLWHGSHNTRAEGERTALLLQYATPDRLMRIPDFDKLDYPFRFLEEPRPPCVMVRGSDHSGRNRIVPGPGSDRRSSMSWIKTLDLPLAEDVRTGWRPYGTFWGPTRCMANLDCHVSVLSAGKTPHEPHSHPEEELLIMLDGEAELVIVASDGAQKTRTVRPGMFVYYEAGQGHTIHNASARPATYLMFRWRNEAAASRFDRLQTRIFRYDDPWGDPDREEARGWRSRRIFEGPTGCLRKLHCHVSSLSRGAGYEPHVDAYDVAILVLGGMVETLGQRLSPHDLAFCSAGEPHGIRNVGDGTASYLVFEFHGEPPRPVPPSLGRRLIELVPRGLRARVPGRVRRTVRKVLL